MESHAVCKTSLMLIIIAAILLAGLPSVLAGSLASDQVWSYQFTPSYVNTTSVVPARGSHTLTINGALPLLPGPYGAQSAFGSNGSSYLTMNGHPTELEGLASYTICTIVQSTSNNLQRIISQQKVFAPHLDATGTQLDMFIGDGSNWKNDFITAQNFPTLGWVTLCYVNYGNSTGVTGVNIYVNGTQQSLTDGIASTMPATYPVSNNVMYFMGDPTQTQYLQGNMSEVCAWNRALTKAEVQSLNGRTCYFAPSPYTIITANDAATSNAILNITAVITNGTTTQTLSTTNGTINTQALIGHVYNYTITATNYLTITTLNYNDSVGVINEQMSQVNNFYFTIKDEDTNQVINNATNGSLNYNFTITAVGDNNNSFQLTTINGSASKLLAIPDTYHITYSSLPTYIARTYFVLLNGQSSPNITLYALNNTRLYSFLASVIDQNGLPAANVYVTAYRFYPISGSYLPVEMSQTNTQGIASFHLVISTTTTTGEYYKFSFATSLTGSTLFTTSPQRIIGDQAFQINTSQNALQDYSNILGGTPFASSLTYNNDTATYVYTFNDPTNSIIQACLGIDNISYATKTRMATTCQQGNAGSIIITTTPAGTQVATAYVTTTTGQYATKTLTNDYTSTTEIFGLNGPILQFFITILASFALLWSIEAFVAGICLSFIIGSWIGIMPSPWTITISIILLGGLIIWRIRK